MPNNPTATGHMTYDTIRRLVAREVLSFTEESCTVCDAMAEIHRRSTPEAVLPVTCLVALLSASSATGLPTRPSATATGRSTTSSVRSSTAASSTLGQLQVGTVFLIDVRGRFRAIGLAACGSCDDRRALRWSDALHVRQAPAMSLSRSDDGESEENAHQYQATRREPMNSMTRTTINIPTWKILHQN